MFEGAVGLTIDTTADKTLVSANSTDHGYFIIKKKRKFASVLFT